MSKYGVFSDPYFPVFGLNTGKYGPEKTTNLDTFHAVIPHANFLVALSTDHTPVTISISKNKNRVHGHGFWKFNSSFLSDQNYVRKIKNLIQPFDSNHNFRKLERLKKS